VFSAGTTRFVDSLSARNPAWRAQSGILMTNLWRHLAAL
jgi:hypothetical protein